MAGYLYQCYVGPCPFSEIMYISYRRRFQRWLYSCPRMSGTSGARAQEKQPTAWGRGRILGRHVKHAFSFYPDDGQSVIHHRQNPTVSTSIIQFRKFRRQHQCTLQLVWGQGVLLVCIVYSTLYREIVALSRKPGYLLCLLFDLEDGGSTFLRNINEWFLLGSIFDPQYGDHIFLVNARLSPKLHGVTTKKKNLTIPKRILSCTT
jgi:hypothetical protein